MSHRNNWNPKRVGVGSEEYHFTGANPVEIILANGSVTEIYPIVAGDYFTGEIGLGYERSYFIIKWFSNDETVTTADLFLYVQHNHMSSLTMVLELRMILLQ